MRMSASVKPSPSPPALPKPAGLRVKINTAAPLIGESERARREKTASGDRSSLQLPSLRYDFIPDELLNSLISTVNPLETCRSSRVTRKGFRVRGLHKTDAAWYHAFGRKKYKYFLDQPTSVTGAGRDISFLRDAISAQKKVSLLPPVADLGSVQKDVNLMGSLIPEEYHIVKNKGVVGLTYYEDKYTILLEDEENRLKIFPSLKPSGRVEAVQLMRVMDAMLDKAGVNQDFPELRESSQMQSLLELVQVEQNIYNIIFHEVIRQVSVECAERGQLLSKLRQRYAALLDRIPRQLKGLHTQSLAQRGLDRRLMEEITRFKSSVSQLSNELSNMKAQDENMSGQVAKAQEDLSKALEQSQRNSDLVAEYHQLYEMQRRRLEAQVARLTEERNLWSRVSYSVVLKVIEAKRLQVADRLHVSERTWAELAEHFVTLLTSRDAEDMNRILQFTDQWKDCVRGFLREMETAERSQREEMRAVGAGVAKWHQWSLANVKGLDKTLNKESEESLFNDLKHWVAALNLQSDLYGGSDLRFQETLDLLSQLHEGWLEVGLRLFKRHLQPDGQPPAGWRAMQNLNATISELHVQLGTRAAGESGVRRLLLSLASMMEPWAAKLTAASDWPGGMPPCDWLQLEKALANWTKLTEGGLEQVSRTQPGSEKPSPHIRINVHEVLAVLREFVFTQSSFFDCENQKLSEEVISIHTSLTRWMVALLLLMVPNCTSDLEAPQLPGPERDSYPLTVQELEEDARCIVQKLDRFSKYLINLYQPVIEEDIQRGMGDESASQLVELKKLQRECGEWIDTCQILLSDLRGHPVDLQVTTTVAKAVTESIGDVLPAVESHKELLVDQVTGSSAALELGGAVLGEQEVPDSPEEAAHLRLIGHDGDIVEKSLGAETVLLAGTETQVMRPQTPSAQRAFNALDTIGLLQQQLLGAEQRALSAEERALSAEESLQAALVRIHELEQQIQGGGAMEERDDSVLAPVTNGESPDPKPASAKTKSRRPKLAQKP
ncbi:axonemal dynein light chain domain-containing protein 1 isoform X2 [Paramormyrops kingsleyae]|uniref:axonemal dynein light chain domain-containing protein 1 isoform X2 n=1 Tax=Paramormyrops kingsleyae TaxID=1676925 RepID=UPI003B9720AA